MNKSMSVVRFCKRGRQFRSTSYKMHYNSNILLLWRTETLGPRIVYPVSNFFIRENKSHTYHISGKVWFCLSVRAKTSWLFFFVVLSMSFLSCSCMLHCLCRNIHVYLQLSFTKLSVYKYIPFTRFLIIPSSYYGLHKTGSINSTSIS